MGGSRSQRPLPAAALPVPVLPRVWRITLADLPISVNSLYRSTERRGLKALTDDAKSQREKFGMVASLSGFRVEAGVSYGVRVTFTQPGQSGDLDNYCKQLLDSIFGKENDRHIVRLELAKRVERGVRQTDVTIYEVTE